MDYPYINCLKSEKFDSGILYGQFLINSLGPGQGISIGNILRRVLLGDLGGTCITAIRIAGIRDEFSVIVGVREDILEILLNLKGVILKSKTLDSQVGRIKVQGPAIITADLIQLPEDLKIINPNHYIATISSNNTVEIELKFDHGTGYKLAGKSFPEKSEDFIELDAIFMPIKKVDFKVETIYDNSKNVSERLLIEIWTNVLHQKKLFLKPHIQLLDYLIH
jgi:DNA-directed RNA polymerase subunit alpha